MKIMRWVFNVLGLLVFLGSVIFLVVMLSVGGGPSNDVLPIDFAFAGLGSLWSICLLLFSIAIERTK